MHGLWPRSTKVCGSACGWWLGGGLVVVSNRHPGRFQVQNGFCFKKGTTPKTVAPEYVEVSLDVVGLVPCLDEYLVRSPTKKALDDGACSVIHVAWGITQGCYRGERLSPDFRDRDRNFLWPTGLCLAKWKHICMFRGLENVWGARPFANLSLPLQASTSGPAYGAIRQVLHLHACSLCAVCRL